VLGGEVGDDYSFEVLNTWIVSSLVRELDHCYTETDLVRDQAELYILSRIRAFGIYEILST
jgi:hypothetical protein